MISNDIRVNWLVGTGHFFSHFYQLCLPPIFLIWQSEFHVTFAELGLTMVLMSGTAAILQTPVGFLVDRYGARLFLIGGASLMSISICAMSLATSFWQILLLSFLSGVGNAVFHPCDYAILSGSIRPEKMGRSFAFHSFTGNIGYAVAPPTVALLLGLMNWRMALLTIGLLGLPVVAALLWQSRFIREQKAGARKEGHLTVTGLLFHRTLVLFFMFFLLGAMASGGIQAWCITILHQIKGFDLSVSAAALTAFMVGSGGGIFLGGYAADKLTRHLTVVVAGLTLVSAAAILAVAFLPVGSTAGLVLLLASGTALGASRTPRDIMLKDVSPPGQIGKVFGFVSAGLPLGTAVTPVPFGFLIDHGMAGLVFPLAAGFLVASIFCLGTAKAWRQTTSGASA